VNGVHDMGGMHGFGPVRREENEPVFHEPWEKTVYAMSTAMRAQRVFNIDESRHAIERMAPAQYLASSYYERWLASLETNLVEKGVLRPDEIEARARLLRDTPDAEVPRREDPELAARVVSARLELGTSPHDRSAPARFRAGDGVVARNVHPKGHTRLPRYIRGKRGVIDRVHGAAILPDANAHGLGETREPLYSVCFEATEVWGEAAEPRQCLYVDLWESYLEAA
jgi:nitrile hydratase